MSVVNIFGVLLMVSMLALVTYAARQSESPRHFMMGLTVQAVLIGLFVLGLHLAQSDAVILFSTKP